MEIIMKNFLAETDSMQFPWMIIQLKKIKKNKKKTHLDRQQEIEAYSINN